MSITFAGNCTGILIETTRGVTKPAKSQRYFFTGDPDNGRRYFLRSLSNKERKNIKNVVFRKDR